MIFVCSQKGTATVTEETDEEEEEDIDFDDDDFEGLLLSLALSLIDVLFLRNKYFLILSSKFIYNDKNTCFICVMAVDEEDMLEHYLAEKSDSSTHSSKRAS